MLSRDTVLSIEDVVWRAAGPVLVCALLSVEDKSRGALWGGWNDTVASSKSALGAVGNIMESTAFAGENGTRGTGWLDVDHAGFAIECGPGRTDRLIGGDAVPAFQVRTLGTHR